VNPSEFESLKLHDAPLDKIEVLWQEKLCRCYVHAFVEHGKDASPHVLEFQGFTLINMPQQEPWGPSCFINSTKYEAGCFLIEMQSGDVIAIDATGFAFRPSNHAIRADEMTAGGSR